MIDLFLSTELGLKYYGKKASIMRKKIYDVSHWSIFDIKDIVKFLTENNSVLFHKFNKFTFTFNILAQMFRIFDARYLATLC